MAAGTIVRLLATALASYALPITKWCRVDASGEAPSPADSSRLSALARSYTRLAEDPEHQPRDGHWSMFHHRPQSVPTTSCRGAKGYSSTYGVSPQQVKT